MKDITKSQREILEHTTYRTANKMYCGDSEDMQSLVQAGLMRSAGKTGFCPDEFFTVTVAGRSILRKDKE